MLEALVWVLAGVGLCTVAIVLLAWYDDWRCWQSGFRPTRHD